MDSHHYLANYELEQEIGQGSFATVYLGYEKTTKLKVAIKAVNTAKLNKKLAKNLASEITILKEIDHPNIIKLYEIQKTEHYIYLVMEYCHAGDLFQHLRRHRVIKEFEAQNLLQQLTSALKVLWDNNLIHRDLKPQNLLLQHDSDSKLIIKIADFGFARYVEPTDLAETLCGSPLYMAPEILRYEKYDAKADLWSIGAIAYEMVFGSPPYKADNHVHLLRIIEAADDSALQFPSSITVKQTRKSSSSRLTGNLKGSNQNVTIKIESSEGLRDFILKLLRKDPNKRIGFKEFFEHPFVNETFSMTSPSISKRKDSVEIINSSLARPFSYLSQNRRQSHSASISISSTDLAIEDILRSEDENLVLLELFDNLDRKPPLFTSLKNCLSLVLLLDRLINYESTQSMSLSMSRAVLSEQRKTKNYSTLLLLYYNIDFLENCLDLLKTAINRENDKSTTDFGNLLKAARTISLKLDREYEVFDSIKVNFKSLLFQSSSQSKSNSNSTCSSSLTRSNSNSIDNENKNKNNANSISNQIRIEDLLLQAACRSAKEGGIQELLVNLEEANSKYLSAILLFNSLLKPSELAPITSKFAQIPAININNQPFINKYLEILKDRI